MENSQESQEQKYTKLYAYSRQYISHNLLKKIGTSFIFCLLLISISLFITYFFRSYPDKLPFYLFYMVLVVTAAIVGDIVLGFVMIFIFTSEALFIFGANNFLVNNIFFVISAIIIVLLISRVKNNDEKEQFKKKQKTYAVKFAELYDDFRKAKKDTKARDEFLSVVSHELRTPLTTMLLTLHNMLNTIRNVSLANFSVPELIKVLKNSEIQIKRLKIIINDLLDVSLITTGKMQLDPKKTDLAKTTKKVIENMSDIIKKKDLITIKANTPVLCNFDKIRIEQAITNLISNAIKYGEDKPIIIKIFNDDKTAHFEIVDQGIGIEKKDQTIIFDLFKRSHWSKEHTNGLGVGLYITNQIVKAHGGELKLSSKPGRGSTFTVILPIK